MLKFSFALFGILRKYNKTTIKLAEACKFPEPLIYEWRVAVGKRLHPSI
jgi:hypothetical protein